MNEILGQRIGESVAAVATLQGCFGPLGGGSSAPQVAMDDQSAASVFDPEDGVDAAFASAYDQQPSFDTGNTMSGVAAAAATTEDADDAAADAGDAGKGGPAAPAKKKKANKKDDDAYVEAASCTQWYERNNASKQCLMAMCMGLGSKDGRTLGDHTEGPYASCKTKSHVKPTRPMLREECDRRFATYGIKERRPNKTKPVQEYIDYLTKYPVTDEEDLKFLHAEEEKSHQSFSLLSKGSSEKKKSPSFGKKESYLRFYHLFEHDTIRDLFLRKDASKNRNQVDAGVNNLETADPSWSWKAADLHNSEEFRPKSYALGKLHSDFAEQIDLCITDDTPKEVTAEKIKQLCADARGKLLHIINKYERSGNGGGNRAETNEEYGHTGRSRIGFRR